MFHLVPKWKWPIWDFEKTYQLVPKRDEPNQEVAETYQLGLTDLRRQKDVPSDP